MPQDFDPRLILDAKSDDEAQAILDKFMGGDEADDDAQDGEEGTAADEDAQEDQQEAEGAPAGTDGGQAAGKVATVPHGAMHEERERRKAADARVAELEAKLAALQSQGQQQPVTPQQPQAEDGASQPDLLVEDPAAIAALIDQALRSRDAQYAPMLAEFQQLRAEKAEQAAIASIAQQFDDPNAAALISTFDQNAPAMKANGVPPAMRYLMAVGLKSLDPNERAAAAAQTQAAAREMAVGQKAKELQNKSTPATPNLAGIPPAAANGAPMDLESVSAKDLLNLSEEKLAKLRMGDFG